MMAGCGWRCDTITIMDCRHARRCWYSEACHGANDMTADASSIISQPRTAGTGVPADYARHRRSEASLAPSTSAANLAHMTVGCWR
jgi:hypothetical protein